MSLILDGTNGLSDIDGTAATPAIRGTDANTGIFFPAADTIAFSEGGAEVARFDSAGNLGIGTSSPSARLHVSSSSNTPAIVQASNAESYLKLTSTGGSSYIGTKTNSIEFLVNEAGNYAASIDSSGTVLVNSTSKQNGDVKFSVTGNNGGAMETKFTADYYPLLIYRSGNLYGSIYQSGTSTAYNTGSDYRLKENIVDLPNALQTLSQLKPRQFNWKETGNTTTGFIAHELAEVLPQAVTGEKDAVETIDDVDEDGKVIGTKEVPKYQGIDTSFLVATLTAAIQELKATVDAQAARIAVLEGAAV